MSDTKDGGPAFPNYIGHPGCLENEGCRVAYGLSLRDYFAAQAISGCLLAVLTRQHDQSAEGLAKAAYKIADAMLLARPTPDAAKGEG